jgi:hypothetical protein
MITLKPEEQEYERRRLVKQLQKRDIELKALKAEKARLQAILAGANENEADERA